MEKIKQLREQTGAGMIECKKALEEAQGDIEKAVEILRKRGITKAAKRSDKETNEGIVKIGVNDAADEAYILEINSETDFVARNDKFQELVEKIFNIIKEKKPENVDELLNLAMEEGTVKETLENLSGVIGEKLAVKQFNILKGASVGSYSHMNGRIGVVLALNKEGQSELAKDIAMHIAAVNPKYLKPEDVSSEELEKEKEIYKEQLLKEGKPEEIIEKILVGKVNKYYEEVCLLKQEFIKDDKKKIEEILGDAEIIDFKRYSL